MSGEAAFAIQAFTCLITPGCHYGSKWTFSVFPATDTLLPFHLTSTT